MNHEREVRDAHEAGLEFVAFVHGLAKVLPPPHHHALEHLLRFCLAIPLNIEAGMSPVPPEERAACLEIARGCAVACRASLDLLAAAGLCPRANLTPGKPLLARILTGLAVPDVHSAVPGPAVRPPAGDRGSASGWMERELRRGPGTDRERRED
jgi:hypothetical protein